MTLNTSQVSYYITQRKKGVTQHISVMKAGIAVRSGCRIEKDQWSKASAPHWWMRKDPLEAVWDSMLVLKERPALMPTTLLGYAAKPPESQPHFTLHPPVTVLWLASVSPDLISGGIF